MSKHKVRRPVKKTKKISHPTGKERTAVDPARRRGSLLLPVTLVAILVAFVLLAVLVKTLPPFPIDLGITQLLQTIRFPLLAEFMYVISWPGFGPQAGIITAFGLLTLYSLGLRWEATTALIAALLSELIDILVKDVIQRPRPPAALVAVVGTPDGYSFPSGHVMFYLGFFGFLWFLSFTLLKPSHLRGVLLVLFGGLIILIGPSRIYEGQHWASDVLGAYLLGSLTLVAIIHFYHWGTNHFFVDRSLTKASS